MMKKEDQELIEKLKGIEFMIMETDYFKPFLDLVIRFKQLSESSRGILIPAGTLKVGDEIVFEGKPKIDLEKIEDLIELYCMARLYPNRTDSKEFKDKWRKRIGYSLTDLPNEKGEAG